MNREDAREICKAIDEMSYRIKAVLDKYIYMPDAGHLAMKIEEAVGLPIGCIMSKTRKVRVMNYRRAICAILREDGNTWHEIRDLMGFSDHAAVANHLKKHDNLYGTDEEYTKAYDLCVKVFNTKAGNPKNEAGENVRGDGLASYAK